MMQMPDLFPQSAAQGDGGKKAASARAGHGQGTNLTPMMAQYMEQRAKYKDYLLFYRMGDFYELFFDDALKAAEALDITLTHRGQLDGKAVPMCGVPVHAADGYLHRLIRRGFKVAVCEQTETPTPAQKMRKQPLARAVVRLVTPGTLSESSLLPPRAHNFLAALIGVGDDKALAWLDMSTGDFFVRSGSRLDMLNELARIAPRELLLPAALAGMAKACKEVVPSLMVSRYETKQNHKDGHIAKIYGQPMQTALDKLSAQNALACASLLSYLQTTQLDAKPSLHLPQTMTQRRIMQIDSIALRNLELTQTQQGKRAGSLLALIDGTQTPMGARLLGSRLVAPLYDLAALKARYDSVQQFLDDGVWRTKVQDALKMMPDIARALQRLALGRGGPRDLAAIRDGYQTGRSLADLLRATKPKGELRPIISALKPKPELHDKLAQALGPNLPLLARDGNFIAKDFAPALDQARVLRDESRRVIANLQARYASETGLKGIKIKHNAVLGYHIELPASQAHRLMQSQHKDKFIHRQTLTNVARFSSDDLTKLGADIERASEKILGMEQAIFHDLCSETLTQQPALQALAQVVAIIDVHAALAALASAQQWVRPTITTDTRFAITAGRHPIVEAARRAQGTGAFIANDCLLVGTKLTKNAPASDTPGPCQLMILTGPNMAGKSTFLRQNALMAILAQLGSFVPAQQAELGLVDQIFCRVGAGDDLASGRSTFMMEMEETATILRNATQHSLVVLDEIGRGTATFDGLSLAWAVVEHLHNHIGCRTLFATHYHELTALESLLQGVHNFAMQVAETSGDVTFLHEVGRGASSRSYGIYVAQLAGLPDSITARARQLLHELETKYVATARPEFLENIPPAPLVQHHDAKPAADALREALTDIDTDAVSPLEALQLLAKLKKLL